MVLLVVDAVWVDIEWESDGKTYLWFVVAVDEEAGHPCWRNVSDCWLVPPSLPMPRRQGKRMGVVGVW